MRLTYPAAMFTFFVLPCFSHAQILSAGHGTPLQCDTGKAVVGACTSGRNNDCGDFSHRLFCSSETLVENQASDPWQGVEVSDFGGEGAWLFCQDQEAMFARCAGGRDEDCRIRGNNDEDHGIKCAELVSDKYIRNGGTPRWVCGDHGDNGSCPKNYVAVASCASGQNNDCDWNGCSGRETYTGLKCLEYATILDFNWDIENQVEKFVVDILAPSANPFFGSFNQSLTFKTSRSGSFFSRSASSSEINTSVQLKITAGYQAPAFGGSSFSAELVATGGVVLSSSKSTFEELSNSYNQTSEWARRVAIEAPSDFEDRIRVVSYKLTRTITVRGTALFDIGGSEVTEEVDASLSTTQEGFLVLRINSFPQLETLTDEGVVLSFVRGDLLAGNGQILVMELGDTRELESDTPTDTPSQLSPSSTPTLPPAAKMSAQPSLSSTQTSSADSSMRVLLALVYCLGSLVVTEW